MRNLFCIFNIVDLLGFDCEVALGLPIQDYEAAIAVVCARNIKADYIITRDEEFAEAGIEPPVISPAAFLEKILG